MAVADLQHPGELLDEAAELERTADELLAEAEQLKAQAKEHCARAAALRNKADRTLHPEMGATVKRGPAKAPDSLMAAAALAVEDFAGLFGEAALASVLKIGPARAKELLKALEAAGRVDAVPERGGYRAVDPEAARVRDAVIELGEFSDVELAEHLDTTPKALTWYLAELRRRGTIEGPDSAMFYVRHARETLVTRRRRVTPPERQVIDSAIQRGEAVENTGRPMIEGGGNRRRAGERKARGGNVKRAKTKGR